MEFHKRRLALLSAFPNDTDGIVFLEGEDIKCRNDTDVELSFRQESNFLYLTGVEDIHGCVATLDLRTGKFTLYVPRISEDEIVWIGTPPSLVELKAMYLYSDSDRVDYKESMNLVKPKKIFTLPFTKIPKYYESAEVDNLLLKEVITSLRMIKSPWEIETMRQVNKYSSEIHANLMKSSKNILNAKSQNLNEIDFASLWYSGCFQRGLFHQAYLPIVAHGKHSAILHYNLNNSKILDKSSFLLVDAGAEYHGYASDITRTWPLSGEFDAKQRIVYSIVLTCQKLILSKIKAGVEWENLHRLATQSICEGLVKANVILPNGASIDDLCFKHFIPQLFFPHGLGHLIGLDVHDVGGYPKGVERIQEPAIRYLRMRRKLQAGMVVTVEPGCYFIDAILDNVSNTQKAFLNIALLNEYRYVGGVRIEDCVLVTEDGHENLTTAPKEIEEIEELMK